MKNRKSGINTDSRANSAAEQPLSRRDSSAAHIGTSLLTLIVLGGAVWIVYGRSLGAPLIFDDSASIEANTSITRLWPLLGDTDRPGPLSRLRDNPVAGRPLVNLTLALNFHFGQLNPAGYRALNICLHALSAWLLFLIVRRSLCLPYFGGRFEHASGFLGFFVALLWALHPLQTEAVVYVTQRTELMVGFFYLATLYWSLRYWAATSATSCRVWLALATLACLAGMASKEVMVSAPVVVLLFERTFVAGTFRKALQQSWPLYLGLALGWLLLMALNFHGPRANVAGFDRGVPAYVWWFTQAKVLLIYLKLVVWPWPLAIHYDLVFLNSPRGAFLWVLPVLILGIGTLKLLWRGNAVGFVGAWVVLILSPTLVVPIISEVAAERRMYLPLAALVALGVVGGYQLLQQCGSRRWLSAVAGCALVVLLLASYILSARRLDAYQDELSLWQDTVAVQPSDSLAHYNLGVVLADRDQIKEAIKHYETAVELDPNYAMAHSNLGVALSQMGRSEAAVEHFEIAVRLEPDNPESQLNLGNALAQVGDLPEAITHFESAAELQPDDARIPYNWATVLYKASRANEAIQLFRQAIKLNPDHAEAHNNLAAALADMGETTEAIEHLQQAVTLNPDYVEAHDNLGGLFLAAGRPLEAIEQYQQSLRLSPNNLRIYANLAEAHAQANQPAEAIAVTEKAIRLARSTGSAELADQIELWLTNYRANLSDSPDHDGSAITLPESQ